ncbi:hypothetical protein PENTCL1PPCAC_22785, partial [Pristionchus entomophagus]
FSMHDGSESSNPSISTEFSSAELLENAENLKSPEKMTIEDLSKLKKRMLMKKLALADNCVPKLAKPDTYIDVGAKEDEERELEWLKGRFPPSHPSKSVSKSTTSCVVQRKQQKEDIMLKLSRQRRQAQEKRKQLYAEDNEELFDDGEDCKEEEEEEEEEEGDEDDVDEENEEGEGEGEEKEEGEGGDMSEDEDVEGKNGESDGKEDRMIAADFSECAETEEIIEDKEENNADDDGKNEKEAVGPVLAESQLSGIAPLSLPDSLSQWFNRSEERLNDRPTVSKDFEEFIQINDLGGKETGSQSDLLNLCSGNFASQVSGALFAADGDDDDDDEEEVVVLARKRKEIFSDDEEQEESQEIKEDASIQDDDYEMIENDNRDGANKVFNRVVIDSDEEEDEEEIEEEEQDERNEEYNDEVEDDEQVDSDDEMAVFRRQEKQRERRRDWVEEEAELSGDDVGSDGEDENDLLDHYEAEEGDLDVVPDNEQLRVDLHKQLMKQQESSDHRELVQLRERLLGDDLNGVETNRTFRLKLREDEDGIEGEEGVENGEKEEEEEVDDQVNIEVIRRRMLMKEKAGDGEEGEEDETSPLDVFSSINRSTSSSNRVGGRVRVSLLNMDSSKMLGKENVISKDKRNNFFISKELNDNEKEREVVEPPPVKRKYTEQDDKPIAKKYKPSAFPTSSLFSKFN